MLQPEHGTAVPCYQLQTGINFAANAEKDLKAMPCQGPMHPDD